MKFLKKSYYEIISVDNLLEAWREFVKGKKKKNDVQLFSISLMENIFRLNTDLMDYTYKHSGYQEFSICDPKPRNIHKAVVRDRLLHHAIHKVLYPFFDKFFITDSFSCRIDKGIHKAIKKFEENTRQASRNNTKTCWVLKCDIKKFFDSVDHEILIKILKQKILDLDILWLLGEVIESFNKQSSQLSLFDLRTDANRERE